jgi:Homeodomain-like domain
MLMCLLYRLLCCLVGLLARGGGERELEIDVLRHQLAILRRGGKRPRYTTGDRALLAAVSRLLPCERWCCFAVSPQTLRRWHRALLAGGQRRGRRRPGRPPLAAETRDLIKRLARENPRWGYVRIQGELLKLGLGVSATTIATVLRNSGLGPAPRRIGPSWSEFLRAQAHSMLGGSPSSVADDDLGDDASEPSGSPQVGPDRQVGASDHLSAGGMPSSHLQLVIPCGAVRRRRARAVSPRPEGGCGCRRRIDPMLATDSKSRPALVPQPSAQAPRQSHPVPATFAANRASNPLGRLRGSTARDVGATDRPPDRARPNRIFFTPQVNGRRRLLRVLGFPGVPQQSIRA